MNAAGEERRLPDSVAGLVAFAASAWAANATLYVALALGVFAACAVVEYVIPGAELTTPLGQFKLFVLQFTELFGLALAIAAGALGVAARAAGLSPQSAALAGGAVERWLPVIAVTFLAQTIVQLTGPASGLGAIPEPRAMVFLTAPLVWILWGVLAMSGPLVALSRHPSGGSVLGGFIRAFAVSLRRTNALRLCGLALVVVLPTVVEELLRPVLVQQHVGRPIFWAYIPIDVLTVGPVTALLTAFALDFVRRAEDQRSA
ncbi:MAG: hypothetical protein JWO66_2206 [Candidatus Eremiobacteraeota bacterium]|nr:hypothetical protein [Candidatus Eremiobacteraeota bacterium]